MLKKSPYYCWGRKHLRTTESEEIARKWKAEGHRVRFVDWEYCATAEWENLLDSGSYCWVDGNQDLFINDSDRKKVQKKVERLEERAQQKTKEAFKKCTVT